MSASATSGAGSIWNPGSWHWESKTYDSWATKTILERLKAVSVTVPGPAGPMTIAVVDVPELKAEVREGARRCRRPSKRPAAARGPVLSCLHALPSAGDRKHSERQAHPGV